MKDPALPFEANSTMNQKTIEIATAAIIVNNTITTPVSANYSA